MNYQNNVSFEGKADINLVFNGVCEGVPAVVCLPAILKRMNFGKPDQLIFVSPGTRIASKRVRKTYEVCYRDAVSSGTCSCE